MKIVIAGGSGFIGNALAAQLHASNHTVTILTRSAGRTRASEGTSVVLWDARTPGPWHETIAECDALVNLTGENIGDKRWTKRQKEKLLRSRIDSVAALAEAIARARKRPSVFVNASAVGYYGNVPAGEVSESHSAGSDFLAQLCVQWEAEASKVTQLGVRVVLLRTGIVLAQHGGALPRMLLPFRLFAGGPLGSGNQWFPWVHLEDELRAIQFAVENPAIQGPVNIAAPNPETMRSFCSTLGTVLHRPSWAPVPGFVLRIALGEMADGLLLGGQKVVPQKLLANGFQFRFKTAEGALRDLLRSGLGH